jgi:type I restriction enzyme S subunit
MAGDYDSVELGEVVSVRSGFAFKSSDWTQSGIAVVKIANVKDGRLVMDGCSFVAPRVAASAAEFALQAGDIVIAMTGYIGDVAIVRERDLPAALNQRVGRFSIRDPRRLDQRFLFYLLRDDEVRKEIEGLGYGSAQPNVSPSLIHCVEVPLPPLPEQRAIAHILGTLDDKIELNRRMSETLEAIARAIFKSWFVDFDPVRAKAEGRDPGLPKHIADLFPDSFEDSELGEIPKGWGVRPLGDLLELAYGKALKEETRQPGPVPVFGSNGQVGWHNEALVTGPGIVVGRKGNPGIVTWAPTDFFCIDTTFYVVPREQGRSLYFLFYALLAQDLASLGADSAVPGLNRNLAYMSKQQVPNAAILDAFDEIARPRFAQVHHLGEQSHTLATLRDTLLPKLISGELRVKDAERILEGAL